MSVNDNIVVLLLNDPNFVVTQDGQVLKQGCHVGYLDHKGYLRVKYRKKHLRVHRIVYAAFVGPLSAGLVINHKDGNKINNDPANLEQISIKANNNHAFNILGQSPIKNYKINKETADRIRSERLAGATLAYLCKRYKLAKSTISYIYNNRTWSNTL